MDKRRIDKIFKQLNAEKKILFVYPEEAKDLYVSPNTIVYIKDGTPLDEV